MSFWRYFKDHWISTAMLGFSLLFLGMLLAAFRINAYGIFFSLFVVAFAYLGGMIFHYIKENNFYKYLEEMVSTLEQKTLLSEMLEEPGFEEGRITVETIQRCNKAMNDAINKYKTNSKEYREYVELWMHEVKTPIATAQLILENHPGAAADSLQEELNKIDGFVEQALFYSRSNTVEKDYLITSLLLRPVVNGVIRRNAKTLIGRGFRPEIEIGEESVYCDDKWLRFILDQLVVNAMKYADKEAPVLRITAREFPDRVSVTVEDNGAGIPVQDVPRVFDKGFTGENGRRFGKSTGMGLYLCKKLCDKLGLNILLTSEAGKGTKVMLIFPKGTLTEDVLT